MAEDKVQLDVVVGGVEPSIKSIKDLKQALKDAKDEQLKAASAFGEGSKEYIKASKNVSSLNDKIGDLNDSTRSLSGSGIERASAGFSQLGEGLRNLDFDKVKVGLTAIKSALAATGVMLIVQAVTYLIENFKELSQGSGFLAKALRFVGDIITDIGEKITFVTDLLGITNSELDKMSEAIVENANKAKEALANQTAEYDRQISIAKASGKSAVDLEKAKQQAVIDTNKALIEQTIAYVRSGGVLTEEQNKLLTEQLNAIKNAKTQQTVIEIEDNKNKVELAKKHNEELAKLREERQKEEEHARQMAIEAQMSDDAQAAYLANLEAQAQARIDAFNAEQEQLNQLNVYYDEVRRLKKEKDDEEELKRIQELELQKRDIQVEETKQGLMATQALSEAYFAFRLRSVEKGSAEEQKIAKKAFEINKALQLATATISGIQSVQNAFTTAAASPVTTVFPAYPFVQAGIAGAFALANIAKIAASKFEGGGGGSISTGGGGAAAPSIPSPPTINTPGANTNTNTLFDSSGKNLNQTPQSQPQITVKAQVVETEMTDKQSEIKTIKNQAIF